MASKNSCKFLTLMSKPFQMLPSVTQIRNVFIVHHMAKVRKQKDIIKTKSCCKFSKISWLVSKRVQLDFKMKKLSSQLFSELFFCIDILFLILKNESIPNTPTRCLNFSFSIECLYCRLFLELVMRFQAISWRT